MGFWKFTKIGTALVLAAALSLAGCSGDKNPSVYAVVDGEEITQEEFDRYVNFLWFDPAVELTDEQRAQVLDEMIQMRVYKAAALERGIESDLEEAKAEYEKFRDQIIAGELFAGSSTMYYARMQELGLTEDWAVQQFEVFQVINKMVDELQAEEPDDAEIEEYYNEKKEQLFAHGELRRVRHILINEGNFSEDQQDDAATLAKDLAADLYDRLLAGEDFAELAKEYSQDTSASAGGDIGFTEKGDVVKEFGDVAFSAELNEVAEPVESEYGWHILQVTEIKEAGYYELDEEVRTYISATLTQETVNEFLTELLESADIKNNLE